MKIRMNRACERNNVYIYGTAPAHFNPTSSTTVSRWETSLSISALLALKSSDHGSAGSGRTGNRGVIEEEAVEEKEEKDRVRNEERARPRPRRGC